MMATDMVIVQTFVSINNLPVSVFVKVLFTHVFGLNIFYSSQDMMKDWAERCLALFMDRKQLVLSFCYVFLSSLHIQLVGFSGSVGKGL